MSVFKSLCIFFLVFTYTISYAQWDELGSLLPDADIGTGESFGSSVSINGSTALIGVPSNSNQGIVSGKAFVFEKVDGFWVKVQTIISPIGRNLHTFGVSVLLVDDLAFIGAPGVEGMSTFATVYIFKRNPNNGEFELFNSLQNPTQDRFSSYGHSLAFNGTILAIVAPGPGSGSSTVGTVYLYKYLVEDTSLTLQVGKFWRQPNLMMYQPVLSKMEFIY